MKKIIVALVILSVVGIFSNSLLAQKRDFRAGDQRGFRHERMFEKLNLTEEQQNTIDDFRYEHQMQAVELHSKLEQNRLMLEKLFDEDNVDESAVMNIVDENNDIHNQLAKSRMEMRVKINSLLTPEQKEELKDRPGVGMGFGKGVRQGRGFGSGKDGGRGMGSGKCWNCPNF